MLWKDLTVDLADFQRWVSGETRKRLGNTINYKLIQARTDSILIASSRAQGQSVAI